MDAAWPVSPGDRAFFPELSTRLAARFTPEWVGTWTPPPAPPADELPDPVFLVGFPRSGTTLLEQMLDAHPELRTLEEKDAIDVVRRRIAGLPGGYPDALATLPAADLAALRALYRAEVARHLGGAAPTGLLVDKMPLNSLEAGLIHRLFPRARFLLALRHPADVVLSNFMQAFKPNAAMAQFSSLASAARFYAEVMALWQQYSAVLPLAVHTVRYEDLVADLEGRPGGSSRFWAFPGAPNCSATGSGQWHVRSPPRATTRWSSPFTGGRSAAGTTTGGSSTKRGRSPFSPPSSPPSATRSDRAGRSAARAEPGRRWRHSRRWEYRPVGDGSSPSPRPARRPEQRRA